MQIRPSILFPQVPMDVDPNQSTPTSLGPPTPMNAPGPAELPIHTGISCDVCNLTIRGVRHKCLDCPNYDMCTPCITSSRGRHAMAHEFLEIEEPRRVIATCDVCNSTIHGVRHKCLDCPDYDMCTPCITNSRGHHAMAHEFIKIEQSRRVIVRTVISGEGERKTNQPPRPPVSGPPSQPVSHNAVCDMCNSKIYGDRYKCLDCPDYDACRQCFAITPERHPHNFVKIIDPQALIIKHHRLEQHSANCDRCQKKIIGIRYKCVTCADYDLCENCEAYPIPFHPSAHHFLKMRSPVVPISYRPQQYLPLS